MSDDGYYLYLSQFTLALMQDSGWYRIDDYSYAESFYFGYHKGCSFVFADCINRHHRYSNFPNFFCDSYDDVGCFYDYTRTSSHCLYSEHLTERVPVEFQYFGYSSIGGPSQTNFCPFLSPHHGTNCLNKGLKNDADELENIFEESIGNTNSRCVQTFSGLTKLTAACFDVYCQAYNEQNKGFDHVIITVNDGVDINENVTCYRKDEGATKNVICPEGVECLSITCPYIDILCGDTQKPFECLHGHWSDSQMQCICSPGYKGDNCSEIDLGVEALQLYSSSDPILITYYNTFCVYGLQWGDENVMNKLNGVWKMEEIDDDSKQYNPRYISENDSNYIMYYRHCDETWYIRDTSLFDTIIAKCRHNRFEWTDYGEVERCDSFWYVNHNLDGDFVRDVNVKMSVGLDAGKEEETCSNLIHNVKPFADYQLLCVTAQTNDVSGTFEIDGVYNGYNSWVNKAANVYLSFEGGSWHLHPFTDSVNDYFFVCYSFESDPAVSCKDGWFDKSQNKIELTIDTNQCVGDQIPTLPTTQTISPSLKPTPSPIEPAVVINEAVCLTNAGESFDGTYKANGTYNGHQIFVKPYLPQLNRPFVYLYFRGNSSWVIYKNTQNDQFWFLECLQNSEDVTDCDGKWVTSWSGNEELITLKNGECQEQNEVPNINPTNKPTSHPITEAEVNENFICVRGTTRDNLDGTYLYNGSYSDHDVFIKEYEPEQNKPFVYIKWEPEYDQWHDDAVYGWIIYRKFASSNYYIYCDAIWAEEYYEQEDKAIYDDPTKCNGHWITNWYNDIDVDITLSHGMCAEDITIADTQSPTKSPNTLPSAPPETTKYCGSEALTGDKPNEFYFDEICLDGVTWESLAGIYKLNGSYNGYPAYVKPYLPDEDKPFVYIKYEDVIIGDIDNDGVSDTRKQWVIYREYCAQSYYLYCDASRNSSDINQCNGYWHTSWNGKDENITSSTNTSKCQMNQAIEIDENNSEQAVIPTAICMSNTGTNSLDGTYVVNGTHNDRNYYRKDYIVNTNDSAFRYIYIKYEQKWKIYSDLDDAYTYFLECDASINSLDVTLCDKKWRGDPNKALIDIRSEDCSAQSIEKAEWPKDTANPIKHHHKARAIVFSIIGIFSFCCLMCFCLIQVRKYNEKNHKFDRLSDVDNDSANDESRTVDHSDIDPDQYEVNEIDVTDITYTKEHTNDDNGIGGGAKTKMTLKEKTNAFLKDKVFNKQRAQRVRSEESVELVSSQSEEVQNRLRSSTEEEDESEDEAVFANEVIDEFTSDLLSDHDEDEDEEVLNDKQNEEEVLNID